MKTKHLEIEHRGHRLCAEELFDGRCTCHISKDHVLEAVVSGRFDVKTALEKGKACVAELINLDRQSVEGETRR